MFEGPLFYDSHRAIDIVETIVCMGKRTILGLYKRILGAGRESKPFHIVHQKGQESQWARTPDGESSDFNCKIMKEMRRGRNLAMRKKRKKRLSGCGCLFKIIYCHAFFVDGDSKVERLPYSWFKGGFKPGLCTDLCWKLTLAHTILPLPLTHQWNITDTLFFIWHLGLGSIKMHVPSGCYRALSCHQCRGSSFSLFSLPVWFPLALGSREMGYKLLRFQNTTWATFTHEWNQYFKSHVPDEKLSFSFAEFVIWARLSTESYFLEWA